MTDEDKLNAVLADIKQEIPLNEEDMNVVLEITRLSLKVRQIENEFDNLRDQGLFVQCQLKELERKNCDIRLSAYHELAKAAQIENKTNHKLCRRHWADKTDKGKCKSVKGE